MASMSDEELINCCIRVAKIYCKLQEYHKDVSPHNETLKQEYQDALKQELDFLKTR